MIESIVLSDVKPIGWEFKHQLNPKLYHHSYHQCLGKKKPRVIQTHEKPQILVWKYFKIIELLVPFFNINKIRIRELLIVVISKTSNNQWISTKQQ